MIYISSQGGCKGDMCPRSNSSRLNSSFFFFLWQGTGEEERQRPHTGEKPVGLTAGHPAAANTQHTQLQRRDVTRETFSKTKRTAWSISYPAPDWPRSPDEAFHNPLIHFGVALFSGNQWSLSSTGRALFSLFFSAWFGNFFSCNVVPAIDHVVNHRSCQTSNDRLWGNKKRTRGALMAGYFYHWLTCALLSNSLKKWNMPQHNLSQLKRFKMLAFNNHLSKTQRYIQFTFVDVVRATTHI